MKKITRHSGLCSMNRGLATRLELMNHPITRCQFTPMRPAKNAHLTPVFLVLAAALFGLGTMNLAGAPGNAGGPTNSNPQLASTRNYGIPGIKEPSPGALTNVMAQIAALKAEAGALSPAQKKIHRSLREASREHRGLAPRTYAPLLRSGLSPLPGGRLLVDITATVSDALLAAIRQL